MNTLPFALEWTFHYPVFGQMREGHGHDFYETEQAMEEQVQRLRAKGIVQITRYTRVNGALVEQEEVSA